MEPRIVSLSQGASEAQYRVTEDGGVEYRVYYPTRELKPWGDWTRVSDTKVARAVVKLLEVTA